MRIKISRENSFKRFPGHTLAATVLLLHVASYTWDSSVPALHSADMRGNMSFTVHNTKHSTFLRDIYCYYYLCTHSYSHMYTVRSTLLYITTYTPEAVLIINSVPMCIHGDENSIAQLIPTLGHNKTSHVPRPHPKCPSFTLLHTSGGMVYMNVWHWISAEQNKANHHCLHKGCFNF